jgi:hypothetical protein
MEKYKTLMHCSIQHDMATGCCVSYRCVSYRCVLLLCVLPLCSWRKIWITLITSYFRIPFVCVLLQSKIDKIPRYNNKFIYVLYILVITHMISANVQVIIKSYLILNDISLPDLTRWSRYKQLQ